MNIAPLISVIIPAYNTLDVIAQTLKSVENQTYQNYQIVIIDDGSTDGTGKFIDSYCEKNEKVIVFHQNNCGVSTARNKGIEIATGEFICFLDSDDTYSTTFLEKMLIRQQQTSANIVYCSFNRVRKDHIVKEILPFDEGNILKSFIRKSFHISGILFKRSFLLQNKIYFDDDLKVCEDIFFTIKAISQTEVVAVKEQLFNYLYRSQSVTNSINTIELYQNDIDTWLLIQSYIIRNYYREDQKEIIQEVHVILIKLKIRLLVEYLKKFNYKEIRNYLEQNSDFNCDSNNFDKKYLHRSDRKKFNIIKSNNLIIWLWGSLYYRYIRRDTGK